MSRGSVAMCTVFLFVLTSSATTPTTNASLKGSYAFQVAGAHQHFWGRQLICVNQTGFMGGSTVSTDAVVGTISFNGSGGVSGTFTQYGKFDQAASNATVSCTSSGHAVYDAPINGTLAGSYSIQPNGTGAMSLTASTGSVPGFVLQLVGLCNINGISDTVLLTEVRSDHSVETTGMARLQ